MKGKTISLQLVSISITVILGVIAILFGLNVSISNTLLLGLIMILIAIQLIWFYSWFQNKDSMFKKDETKNRERAYNLIKESNLSLHTTHFARSVPPEDYTLKIIEKLKNGIDVYRIIDKKMLANKDIQNWIKQFHKYPNYHQSVTDKELPFDISVFDGKKAILYFPGHPLADDFDMSLYIDNEQLAHIFMMVFSKIKGEKPKFHISSNTKNNKSWLKDAYHLPYLVIEGIVLNNNSINLDEKLSSSYRKIDLNNIGKVYALDDNNRVIFCIDNDRCALCYYISGETTSELTYTDILTSVRTTLDSNISGLENFLINNDVKLKLNKLYLEDPARGIG